MFDLPLSNSSQKNNGEVVKKDDETQIRPCYGIHDCRKALLEQQPKREEKRYTEFTPCTGDCNTNLGNLTLPVHAASFDNGQKGALAPNLCPSGQMPRVN